LDFIQAFDLGTVIQNFKLARIVKPTVDDLFGDFAYLDWSYEFWGLDARDFLLDIRLWIKELEKKEEKNARITEDDALKLSQDATKWQHYLAGLLHERQVIELVRSGTLNQKALIDASKGETNAFFNEKTWNALSNIEKNDFSNAAKCLLAGIPTPAVMIVLRGAEATVKKYYEFKTGDPAKEKMWGAIVKELKRRATELNMKDSFIGYLDYIRDAKRNFAEHPNTVYGQREAELIFMEVINLVQDTYAEILEAS
jgi:hypothetical protein